MSKHLDNWLQAYFDGELDKKRQDEVELHLDECEHCTGKLNEFAVLSSLLHEENPITQKMKVDQFTAQVLRQLPVKKKGLWWNRFGKITFAFIPAVLLITMLFIKTTSYTNLLLTGAELLGFGGEEVSTLISGPLFDAPANPIDLSSIELFDTGTLIWNSFGSIRLFGVDLIDTFVLPLLIGLIAVSWMIGWWVEQDKKQNVQLKFN